MKPLKSIEQAASLLGLSIWTVRAYIREGKLRPVRLGRRVLLEEDQLEKLINEGRTGRETDYEQPTAVRNVDGLTGESNA